MITIFFIQPIFYANSIYKLIEIICRKDALRIKMLYTFFPKNVIMVKYAKLYFNTGFLLVKLIRRNH